MSDTAAERKTNFYRLFHHLWGKAASSPDYVKQEWKDLFFLTHQVKFGPEELNTRCKGCGSALTPSRFCSKSSCDYYIKSQLDP